MPPISLIDHAFGTGPSRCVWQHELYVVHATLAIENGPKPKRQREAEKDLLFYL